MGAKVEAESYKPGYYATGDLNVNANGWSSSYIEDMTSNVQLRNHFMTKQANGDSEYDKEMLKHKMLEHEAVFRQQLYELHRVYRIQRDFMKQYQNKEICASPLPGDGSQTNSPSQVPPDSAKMIWQLQTPPVSTTYSKATGAENNNTNHSLKFLSEGSVQSSPNGFPSSDVALNNKRGTLDLQLPADHYMDDDDASANKPIDFLGLKSDTKPQIDADGIFVRAHGLGRFSDNSSTSAFQTDNKLGGRHIADLNEPISGMYMGGPDVPVPRGLSYTLEHPSHQSVLRSSTANYSLSKDYSKDKCTDEGTSSNFFGASSRTGQEEKPFVDKGKQTSDMNNFMPRYSDANLQEHFKAADRRSARNNQFMYQAQNNSVGWFSRNLLEGSAINNFARFDHAHHSSFSTLVPPISIPHIDHPSAASPISSYTIDPRSSIINNAAIRSVPSFNGSSTVDSYRCLGAVPQGIGSSNYKVKKINKIDDSYSGLPLDSFSASRARPQLTMSSELEQRNGLMCERKARQFDQNPHFANGNGTKNFNLNEALSDVQEDVLVERVEGCVGSLRHGEGEGSVSGIPWLKTSASCTDSRGFEKPLKVFGHSNGTVLAMKNKNDRTGAASEDITAVTPLACNKTQERSACFSVLCQKNVPGDGQAAEGAPIRNFIDLNDDAPNEDNSESSVASRECHATSLQNNHAKRTFVIDLEVPACEDDAAWISHQECTPSDKLDACKEADTHFSAVTAAENILALSNDVPRIAGAADDMLLWFAELAVLNIDDLAEQVEVQDCINNASDDGLESFESLTLKLEETKIDEYWSRPQAPAITNQEQTVSAVNLLTKPKRGQQRKRRQKRDFQKDILPSLSSLSRPDIIEDIQLLEGLVQTSGGSWESTLTKRRRYGGRTRGRKPKKKLPDTIEEELEVEVEVEVEISPPAKPDGAGLEADDKSMMGWGRTIRRCRRPRCPSGNTIAAAS